MRILNSSISVKKISLQKFFLGELMNYTGTFVNLSLYSQYV